MIFSSGATKRLTCAKTALIAAFLISAAITHDPRPAFAEGPQAVGTGEGNSSATGIGGNTSANQSSNFTAAADTTVGGQYSATGTAATDANANQSTGGSTSSASAATDTDANADNLGGFYQAGASGQAGSAGTLDGQTSAGEITASAQASAGATPTAKASTSLDGLLTTMATAAYQQAGTFYCSAGCTTGYSKQTGKKTVSVAVQDDAFSLAVASRKSAYAKSGAINDFNKKEQKTITRSLSVGAYAKANQKSARGVAVANARPPAPRSATSTTRNISASQRQEHLPGRAPALAMVAARAKAGPMQRLPHAALRSFANATAHRARWAISPSRAANTKWLPAETKQRECKRRRSPALFSCPGTRMVWRRGTNRPQMTLSA